MRVCFVPGGTAAIHKIYAIMRKEQCGTIKSISEDSRQEVKGWTQMNLFHLTPCIPLS